MDKQIRPFGMRDKIGYMFGDFGNDFTFILSSAFMLKFYTDVMGIGAGVVGMLMMAARFLMHSRTLQWDRLWIGVNRGRTENFAHG